MTSFKHQMLEKEHKYHIITLIIHNAEKHSRNAGSTKILIASQLLILEIIPIEM